jgi:4-alpha-glucanotransferase
MRASGVLLHPTSLPGPYGIGDLGLQAYHFADWMGGAGLTVWQVLPLGPTGYGESPYQLFSAFAGNPLLVSLDRIAELGWLDPAFLREAPQFCEEKVDFERVIPWKFGMLRNAFERFEPGEEYSRFCREECSWLDDYARFMSLKELQGGLAWTDWKADVEADARAMDFHRFVQFEFFREWRALREYCSARGIRVMGDLPIYVAHDSADVWSRPDLFRFDVVAGVPPDYFSATGQLWGNPIYRWDRMEKEGYGWWIERMRAALRMFDLVRMDHFRGFEAYWQVASGETTAVNGEWVRGPGAEFFGILEAALGRLPLVAENLGVITPEVEAIRQAFGFPGMAILQFAFGKDPQAPGFLPHNYDRNCVAYTGTHDNDTVMGWWRSEGGDSVRTPEDVAKEKARARAYLNTDGAEMHQVMIRTLMASVADTVLFPMQDILGLDSEARMNTPSVPSGNWRWRLRREALHGEHGDSLRRLTEVYGR